MTLETLTSLAQEKIGHQLTMEKSRLAILNRNKSDTYFTFFVAKQIRNNSQTITFSIIKVNSDLGLVNKSLNIELNNSLDSYGRSNRQLQQTGKGDLNNGRSETSIQSRTDIEISATTKKTRSRQHI